MEEQARILLENAQQVYDNVKQETSFWSLNVCIDRVAEMQGIDQNIVKLAKQL